MVKCAFLVACHLCVTSHHRFIPPCVCVRKHSEQGIARCERFVFRIPFFSVFHTAHKMPVCSTICHMRKRCVYEYTKTENQKYEYELAIMRSANKYSQRGAIHCYTYGSDGFAVVCRIQNFTHIMSCMPSLCSRFSLFHSFAGVYAVCVCVCVPHIRYSRHHIQPCLNYSFKCVWIYIFSWFMGLMCDGAVIVVCCVGDGNTALRIGHKYIIPLCPEFFRRWYYTYVPK